MDLMKEWEKFLLKMKDHTQRKVQEQNPISTIILQDKTCRTQETTCTTTTVQSTTEVTLEEEDD